jgi:hypothetical protein
VLTGPARVLRGPQAEPGIARIACSLRISVNIEFRLTFPGTDLTSADTESWFSRRRR